MNNTIFDDVFRTMIEKMPYLAVPLINEVFHTSYPEDVKITQLRNEHQQKDGEIITDSCLLIGKKMYHIECQSTDDTTMAIRMIEYDFAISIEHAEKQGRRYRIEFPKSCVLFLRNSENTPDYLEAEAVRKGLGDIMGGKVLELESERLKAEGQAIGQAQGEARLGSLINRLIQEQRIDEIQVVSTDSERRDQLYKEYNL